MNALTKQANIYLEHLIQRYSALKGIQDDILKAYFLLEECFEHGGKLLVAGNGGSAADAEHMVGELMKSFKLSRPINLGIAEKLKQIDPGRGVILTKELENTLTAIALTDHISLTTAYCNDVGNYSLYAQQLYGYGKKGDVFLGISTSGNSENILRAAVVAKAKGIKVIGLTGKHGGILSNFSDVIVRAPERETYLIQELHLPIYHCWCLMLEEHFFGK